MEGHNFMFASGAVLFTVGVIFATFQLERQRNKWTSKIQPTINFVMPAAGLLVMSACPNISMMSAVIVLCAIGGWSMSQVIYALSSGQARRFGRSVSTGPADLGYCLRAAEPGWFWYHISVYALQACMAFVLPLYAFSIMISVH